MAMFNRDVKSPDGIWEVFGIFSRIGEFVVVLSTDIWRCYPFPKDGDIGYEPAWLVGWDDDP